MDEDRFPDLNRPELGRDDPDPDRVNHLAYILLALIVMLIFWYGSS